MCLQLMGRGLVVLVHAAKPHQQALCLQPMAQALVVLMQPSKAPRKDPQVEESAQALVRPEQQVLARQQKHPLALPMGQGLLLLHLNRCRQQGQLPLRLLVLGHRVSQAMAPGHKVSRGLARAVVVVVCGRPLGTPNNQLPVVQKARTDGMAKAAKGQAQVLVLGSQIVYRPGKLLVHPRS